MIFLISFCVVAQMALNSVEMAPRHSVRVSMFGVELIIGFVRINKNTPATTIVLECSSADTGVGPSIAAGSHGCSPNWADFPVAASSRPRARMRLGSFSSEKVSWMSHVVIVMANHAVARISPMSPIRL